MRSLYVVVNAVSHPAVADACRHAGCGSCDRWRRSTRAATHLAMTTAMRWRIPRRMMLGSRPSLAATAAATAPKAASEPLAAPPWCSKTAGTYTSPSAAHLASVLFRARFATSQASAAAACHSDPAVVPQLPSPKALTTAKSKQTRSARTARLPSGSCRANAR